jgi:membrane protein
MKVIRIAYKLFISKNPLQMAGATAFFTTFALPCILLILVQTIGIFYSKKNVKEGIFAQLTKVLGKGGSAKINGILNQFQKAEYNWIAAIAGFIFMLFVVTTLFNVVRNTIHTIWNIRVKEHPGIKFYFNLRLKSVLIIVFAGIIVTAQLLASALQGLLKDSIDDIWSDYNSILFEIISQVVFMIIACGWFTVLFKYLASAHPVWKVALTGGIFTGILFTVGKIIIGLLLSLTALEAVFGNAGSFVLVLLFVFYSSFIFYYGAAFKKARANENNSEFELYKNVRRYHVKQTA